MEEKELEVRLTKKVVNPVVIEGFPGFGLIGTIATEFLVEHLKCEQIGRFWFEDLPPTIAIHEKKVVDPVGVYYNKKNNIVIIHSISGALGIEWLASDYILEIARQTKAKQLISIEGVGSASPSKTSKVFHYSNKPAVSSAISKLGVDPLKEGIIMGVTGSLLVKTELPFLCLFAETHSALPDSKAAARVIQVLDKYLGLGVDYRPLLKQAEKFESKIKTLIEQSQKAEGLAEKKQLSYVG